MQYAVQNSFIIIIDLNNKLTLHALKMPTFNIFAY